MKHTAIIAGRGRLPLMLAEALDDPIVVHFDDLDLPDNVRHIEARIEKLGRLFKALKSEGVRNVTFAGAMERPKVNPLKLDRFALRLAMNIRRGDDALFREVIEVFEGQGFEVISATDILPSLALEPDTRWGRKPDDEDIADAERARSVIDALAPMDVAQGAVCAGGLMLGIETIQGTDAMLNFVGQTPDKLRRARGVFVKVPKLGQDLRIDMPTIGPDTVEAVIAAGIGGIVIPARNVLVIDAKTVQKRVEDADLFLMAQ